MLPESVLLESRSVRDSVAGRTEVLDKIKALELLPDGLHVTTQMVADYFEVGERAVNNLLNRHREELETNGLRVLRGAELQEFKSFNLKLFPQSYPQPRSSLALWPRRAVLNVGMLLRDSPVAIQVRAYLLDSEERTRTKPPFDAEAACRSLDRRVTVIESHIADLGAAVQDLGPVLWRMSVRLERIEQRLDDMDTRLRVSNRVVCALGERVLTQGGDLDDLRRLERRLETRVSRLEREAAGQRRRR